MSPRFPIVGEAGRRLGWMAPDVRKEFFRVGLNDVRKVIGDMKLEVKWTLTAEAREYRETLTLEQKLRDDPEFRKRWIEEQGFFDRLADFEEAESVDGPGSATDDASIIPIEYDLAV
jgi:hypothetical protein